MKKYIKNCPNCGIEITYNRSDTLKSSIDKNKLCRSCAQKNRPERISLYSDKIKYGMRFGKWEVIGDIIKNGGLVETKCDCGYITKTRINRLLNGSTVGCRKCTIIGENSSNWKGVGSLPSTITTIIKLRAKNRGIDYLLSSEYLWDLYLKQNKKCALSGLPIDFTKNGRASLDRIDSSIGYVEGNVHWVYNKINIMKNEYTQTEFLELCKIITEYDKNRIKQ
jgi:hypothetical protein